VLSPGSSGGFGFVSSPATAAGTAGGAEPGSAQAGG
jgi:hypothetical protein